MGALIHHPWLALLPALAAAGLWRWRRRKAAWIAALAWLVYAGYEAAMHARLLCSGECNIRIDLLFVFPALLVLSFWALIASLRPRARTPEPLP